MTALFDVRPMTPADYLAVDVQPSQQHWLGETVPQTEESAAQVADAGEAWACYDDDRLIGCMGIGETFAGRQGVAWALLGRSIGPAHLAMTRFARQRIAESPLVRIEAMAHAACAETILHHFPALDGAQLLAAVMAMPTPECTWLCLLGMEPKHVLRRFGAASETYVLFERIRPCT